MAGTEILREWAANDRAAADDLDDQIAAIRYLARVGTDNAQASQSEAQASELESAQVTLRATGDGWEEIAEAADEASGEVGNPDGSP